MLSDTLCIQGQMIPTNGNTWRYCITVPLENPDNYVCDSRKFQWIETDCRTPELKHTKNQGFLLLNKTQPWLWVPHYIISVAMSSAQASRILFPDYAGFGARPWSLTEGTFVQHVHLPGLLMQHVPLQSLPLNLIKRKPNDFFLLPECSLIVKSALSVHVTGRQPDPEIWVVIQWPHLPSELQLSLYR